MADNINMVALEAFLKTTKIEKSKVISTLSLIVNEEKTVPFVARYRKEATGGLEDTDIISIVEGYGSSVEIENRRVFIYDTLKKQEVLTPLLEKNIKAATTLNQLEDIYAPFKSKRKTKGQVATENGLAPLAELIKASPLSLEVLKGKHEKQFLNEKIKTFAEALEGALDIITEEIYNNVEIKDSLRNLYWEEAEISSEKRPKAEEIKNYHKYQDYFEFKQKLSDIKLPKNSHRYLAIRRGMLEKVLKVDILFDKEKAHRIIQNKIYPEITKLGCKDLIEKSIAKAYSVYISTNLSAEINTDLKALADEAAIKIFGVNLKNLLLQPYLGQKAVMGIDPGVRTGCKIALIDKNGKYIFDTVIYPHEPQRKIKESAEVITKLLEMFHIEYIAIGSGTFGRETLAFVQEHVDKVKTKKVKAVLVNEDGASIYSASEIARDEFPDKDVTVRGAISIARRFQDPLAELVKIDPKSIGVGQYQHDVNTSKLKDSLTNVVESCVNYVGVDLNTASAPLLSYISGIGPGIAKNIVKYREDNGGFKDRSHLLKVSRFSNKAFELSAGFLRIYNGENPLDSTFIHPERYEILKKWSKKQGIALKDLRENSSKLEKDGELKKELGAFTFEDVVKSLKAPSQDPRTEFSPFEYRKDISDFNDIVKGQIYPGIVTNITQFGAFVDIGIKENGLVHVSQISDQFVEDPLSVLKVGQSVKAYVLDIDKDRKRISLSLKSNPEGPIVKKNPGGKRKEHKGHQRNFNSPSDDKTTLLQNLKI